MAAVAVAEGRIAGTGRFRRKGGAAATRSGAESRRDAFLDRPRNQAGTRIRAVRLGR